MQICGSFTDGQKKPCKTCKHFFLWGVNTGFCGKQMINMATWEHCKYYKRNSEIWCKNGKCKFNENELYV